MVSTSSLDNEGHANWNVGCQLVLRQNVERMRGSFWSRRIDKKSLEGVLIEIRYYVDKRADTDLRQAKLESFG